MFNSLTIIGAESAPSGIGALGINGQALLIQLVTFLLAYFVLRRFAFQPILNVLRERRELIEKGVKLGEDMQREKAELDSKVTATLQDARRQADGIVAVANDAARDTQRDAEEKARQKAENILTDAHSRAEQDIVRMRGQLQSELVTLVSDATEAIIDEKVDAKKDASLIDRALKSQRQPQSQKLGQRT
ncbi:MAG TPA: F0F1 ATP synthase subunit B [Candidatus Saccharimonadales bacterium]|jgi:F-type H+-transporting ATPase subunit b